MTRRSQVSIEKRRNVLEVRRQSTVARYRGLSPLELYDIWGRCHAYYDATPPVPRPELMEAATLDGSIYKWFPSIGQSMEPGQFMTCRDCRSPAQCRRYEICPIGERPDDDDDLHR